MTSAGGRILHSFIFVYDELEHREAAMNPYWQRKMLVSDAETSNFREGSVFYLSECSPEFKASFHQAHEAIKHQCFEKLIIAVETMKKSCDVPKADCLDVCHLIPGMTGEPWDEVPITLLAYAGYYGRQDMIDYLIQEGANVDMGSPMSGTPLMQMMVYCQIQRAPQSLSISIINHFIKKSAVLSRVLTAGFCENTTALEVSIHLQRYDIAQTLVQAGLDPILGGEPNSPPVLMEYLQFGSHNFISWVLDEHLNPQEVPNFVRALLDKGVFSNEATNHFAEVLGRNTVHGILLCGRREAVYSLLDEKPHFMTTCDPFKKTALHIAAEKGDINTVNILLEGNYPLDLEARDQVGMTSLMLATRFGHKEVVVTLLQKMLERGIGGEEAFAAEGVPMKIWVLQNGYSAYFEAMHEIVGLEMILHRNVDNYGNTVVHLAAESGYSSVFKSTFPLVKGHNAPTFKMLADKNFDGKTPLHLAIDKGDVSILTALQEHREQREKKALAANDLQAWQDEALEKKAWQEFWNAESMGLLHYSCFYGTVQIVKYFISTGISPTTVYEGYTPLSRASRAGKDEIVSFLLSIKGVSPNKRNKERGCPLLLAARNGHTKCVTILLEKGADIKAKSKEGYNCLMEAIKWEHQATALAILAHKDWKDTLRVCVQNGGNIISPMRMLIESMPDIALIVLNKCLSIRSETVRSGDAEGISVRKLQKVHYSFEFIEDHQKGDQITSQRDGNKASEFVEFTDFTANETTKVEEREERVKEEEGEGVGDDNERLYQGEAEAEITQEQGEEIVEEDTAVQEEEQVNVDDSEVEEDVDFLWVNYSSNQIALDGGETFPPQWGPKGYHRSHHPLTLMIDNHRLPLLQHPLMKRYIEYKWWRVALPLYMIYRFFYVIFLILLTAFALTSPRPGPENQYCPSNSSGDAYAELHLKDGECKELSRIDELYLKVSSIILIFISLVYLVIETTQVFRRKWKYFLSYENYLQIALFVLTIMFVSGFSHDCWCFPGWQWQIGALAVFLGWFNIVILLNDMPWIGIPINMLFNIMFTFLKLIFLPILLIISFAIPFYMLFVRDNAALQGEDAAGILVAFSSPFHSIAKTLMQTTGELDFDSIFNDANLLYSPMAYFLFFSFVIIMPILFQNLLIGLAVGDTGEEIKNATFTNIKLQAEYVLELEEHSRLSRRLMRLQFLEFKEKFHDPSRAWWERGYQKFLQQWDMFWGIDCDTQQRIVRDNEEESNDAMEKIKETGPVAVLKEKVNTLNKTISKMEQLLTSMEKKQQEFRGQFIHQFKGELIDSIQEKLKHTLHDFKSDVEKMVGQVTSK